MENKTESIKRRSSPSLIESVAGLVTTAAIFGIIGSAALGHNPSRPIGDALRFTRSIQYEGHGEFSYECSPSKRCFLGRDEQYHGIRSTPRGFIANLGAEESALDQDAKPLFSLQSIRETPSGYEGSIGSCDYNFDENGRLVSSDNRESCAVFLQNERFY